MVDSDLPNPSTTIIYFMLITLCFIFFTIYNILQTKEKETVADVTDNNVIHSIYILMLVVGSYFINATISKSMCSQSIQWTYILMVTLLPWIVIFISLYFILKIFPGWISPFSNTIGYAIIGFLGVEKIYDSIFKTDKEASGQIEVVKAIANMNSNKGKFINQISTELDEFDSFFSSIKATLKPEIANKLKSDGDGKQSDGDGKQSDVILTGEHHIEGYLSPREIGKKIDDKLKSHGDGNNRTIDFKTPFDEPLADEIFNKRSLPSVQPRISMGGMTDLKGGEPPVVGIRIDDSTSSTVKETTLVKDSKLSEEKDPLDPLFKLYQLLVIKQVIGKIVWYILAGILISSISYNLVISMACEKSLAEIQKDFETAREKAEESSASATS